MKEKKKEAVVATGVQVCGGKACMKVGAEAVAGMMLGRGELPNTGCLKQCGGVGPSVCLNGQIIKVDIKGAVSEAVANAEHLK